MKKQCVLIVTTVLGFILLPAVALNAKQPTSPQAGADIEISAVDINENPLPSLKAGQYARLRVRAMAGSLPDGASARITAVASYTTTILGRKVSYRVNLPVSGSIGSSLDPTVGMPNSGQKLGAEVEYQTVRETFDIYVPSEAPAGKLVLTIKVTASSAAPLTRNFNLQVVR